MTREYTMTLTTPSDREITTTRFFGAPRDLVWNACAEPELVKRWMIGLPGHSLPVCEIDLRIGGALRYVWIVEEGKEMGLKGVFREIKAPERIVHTETVDDWPANKRLVTTLFEEQDARTRNGGIAGFIVIQCQKG